MTKSSHDFFGTDAMAVLGSIIEQINARLDCLSTEEGRLRGLAFIPRSDDVLITTYPKNGTTWVQQIVHQLRTRGNMEFEEITDVIPWIELAADMGANLEADQVAVPRAYKSHCWYGQCPKGAKYIVVIRDPRAVALSFFKMMCGWVFRPDEIDVNTFLREVFLARGLPDRKTSKGSYWYFYSSWWPHRNDPNVLWLFYEDMLEDPLDAVRKIAMFINCGAKDKKLLQLVVKQSSLEFMKQHVEKFDDHVLKGKRNPVMGLAKDATGAAKVRAGEKEEYKTVLSLETIQAIDDRWKLMEEATGYPSYAELRNSVKK